MENHSNKLNTQNLTKNNIEKIKKSIDCLKATIQRSNSHLYLNNSNPIKISYNKKATSENETSNFSYTQRHIYNHTKNNKHSITNESSNILDKNIISSSTKKLNNISFYNINIANANDRRKKESIDNGYNSELSYGNKLRNNSAINKKVLNNSHNTYQINQDKIKNSIYILEKVNKELKEKYKNIIEAYKSSISKNNFLIKQKSELIQKLKEIRIINSNLKNKIDTYKTKEENNDINNKNKNKIYLLEKNKELKGQIEKKDKIISNLKKEINDLIKGENNLINVDKISNANNTIDDLKNKINKINEEIMKQEVILKSE